MFVLSATLLAAFCLLFFFPSESRTTSWAGLWIAGGGTAQLIIVAMFCLFPIALATLMWELFVRRRKRIIVVCLLFLASFSVSIYFHQSQRDLAETVFVAAYADFFTKNFAEVNGSQPDVILRQSISDAHVKAIIFTKLELPSNGQVDVATIDKFGRAFDGMRGCTIYSRAITEALYLLNAYCSG
jgi:hypothetical protein